jgi:hypothetical protein
VLVCDGRHLQGWHDPGLLLHRFGVTRLFQLMAANRGNVDPALVIANCLFPAQAAQLPIALALRHGNARIDRVVLALRQNVDGTLAVRIVVDGEFDAVSIAGILGDGLPPTPLLLEREYTAGRAVIGSLASSAEASVVASWNAAFAQRPDHDAIRLLAPRPPPPLILELVPLTGLARGALAIASSESTGTAFHLDLDFVDDATAAAAGDLLQYDPFTADPPAPPAPAGAGLRGRSLLEMLTHDQIAAAWAARHWDSEGRRVELALHIPEDSLPAVLRQLLLPDFDNPQLQQWFDPDRPFAIFDPLMKPLGP